MYSVSVRICHISRCSSYVPLIHMSAGIRASESARAIYTLSKTIAVRVKVRTPVERARE